MNDTTTEPTAPEPASAAETAADTAERDAYAQGYAHGFRAAIQQLTDALGRSPSGRIQVANLNRNGDAHKRGEG